MSKEDFDNIIAYLDALGHQLRDSLMKLVQLQKVMKDLQNELNNAKIEE